MEDSPKIRRVWYYNKKPDSPDQNNETPDAVTPDGGLPVDNEPTDAQQSISLSNPQELFALIEDAAMQVIEPTATTGKNTEKLIRFCQKLIGNVRAIHAISVANLDTADKIQGHVDSFVGHIEAGNKVIEGDRIVTNTSEAIFQIAKDCSLMLQQHQSIVEHTRDLEEEISTTIKVAETLLREQVTKGEDIKAGALLLRYNIARNTIGAQWQTMKKGFAVLEQSKVESNRRSAKVMSWKTEIVIEDS